MKSFPHIAFKCADTANPVVWSCDTPTGSDATFLEDYLLWLSEEERQKAHRFKQSTDRNAYLTNHLLLRVLLSEYFDVPPYHWSFFQGDDGRPHIVSVKSVSLSRTRQQVVAAFTMHGALGVDVENIDGFTSFYDGYSKAFTAGEIQSVKDTPDQQKNYELTRLWTRKEAISKVLGLGLMMKFNQVDVRPTSPRTSDPERLGDFKAPWLMTSFASHSNHIISLAGRGQAEEADLEIRHIPFSLLQEKIESWGHIIESA